MVHLAQVLRAFVAQLASVFAAFFQQLVTLFKRLTGQKTEEGDTGW